MAQHLRRAVDKLKKKLISLNHLVATSVSDSTYALTHLDAEVAHKVVEADCIIDQAEVEVEEECLKVLALYQPVATDLRFVVSILKINNDLERIGDLSVNIAERALYLCRKKPIETPYAYDEIVEKVITMLKKTMEAFVEEDLAKAAEVCADGSEIDDLQSRMYGKIYRAVRKDPERVKILTHYLSVSRQLKRMADYAENICEDIIYLVDGKIVRHKSEHIIEV